MSIRKKISIVLGLLAILGILGSSYSLTKNTANPTALRTNQAPFSAAGPFEVGTRTQKIPSETPLGITVWYPGLVNTSDNLISYSFEIKFQKPLGRIAIATYEGHAMSDAPVDLSLAPYPLVVLSPGFSISPAAYGWLAEHLASYGFVVISPDHAETLDPDNDLWKAVIERPKDILTVFDFVDQQVDDGGLLEGMIDSNLVAVAGHSYGGYTSLAAAGARIDPTQIVNDCEQVSSPSEPGAWLCNQLLPHMDDMAKMAGLEPEKEGLFLPVADRRVDAVISMAGNALFFSQESLSQISIPVLAIGGTSDEDSPFKWSTHPTYEYTSSTSKIKIALKGAEHMIFTGPCEKTPFYLQVFSGEFCSDSTWNRSDAHTLIKHFTTAFLLAEIKNDPSAISALALEGVDFNNIDYEAIGYGN